MNEKNLHKNLLPHNLLVVALGFSLVTLAPFSNAGEQQVLSNKQGAATTSPDYGSIELPPQINIPKGKSVIFKIPPDTIRMDIGGACDKFTKETVSGKEKVTVKGRVTQDGKDDLNWEKSISVKNDDEKVDTCVVSARPISSRELYLVGRSVGSTNIVLRNKSRQVTVVDINVSMDTGSLQTRLQQIMPNEKGIKVSTAAESLVLSGTVSDAVKADKAMALAEAYGGKDKEKKVINMLQVAAPQQVMLEVKMAEVSKSLVDKLGASFGASRVNGGVAYAIASGFLSLTGADPLSPGGLLTITKGNTAIKIDAENKDGVVKILAEPNIIAISGQEGSFLAGGKIFIPVPQNNTGGGASVLTLEERDFGVGLKFTPTVLEEGMINLRVAPEVSELTQGGTTVGGSVFPSFTVRRVATTVQLRDGQSFAIAGLIKNNVTESVRRFPILGDIPIIGALFRSSSFQEDKTELLFVVTPRLVKPLPPNFALPTDNFTPPSKAEFFLNGKLEGKPAEPAAEESPAQSAPAPQPNAAAPEQSGAKDGFEMK